MGTNYGRNYKKISISDIQSINLQNVTLSSNYDGADGAIIAVNHSSVTGCGTSAFTILLNDVVKWKFISYKIYLTGTTSCWAFSQGTTYAPVTANILTWDAGQDRVFFSKNCWELPQYTLKMNTCDNNADNFFHASFHTGSYKEFFTMRRRDSMTSLAGLSCGRACLSDGQTIISDIRVW